MDVSFLYFIPLNDISDAFLLTRSDGSTLAWDYTTSREKCEELGLRIANYTDLEKAHQQGASSCAKVWMDNTEAGYVYQEVKSNCGNKDGVKHAANHHIQALVATCTGHIGRPSVICKGTCGYGECNTCGKIWILIKMYLQVSFLHSCLYCIINVVKCVVFHCYIFRLWLSG